MNKAFIIGNITKNPELRVTPGGISVCSFTVAVDRRRREETEADYFRVTAWRDQAESCGKYLKKGNKVAVVGSVSVSTYQDRNGTTRASLDLQAQDVEFLSPKEKTEEKTIEKTEAKKIDYVEVTDENLPF